MKCLSLLTVQAKMPPSGRTVEVVGRTDLSWGRGRETKRLPASPTKTGRGNSAVTCLLPLRPYPPRVSARTWAHYQYVDWAFLYTHTGQSMCINHPHTVRQEMEGRGVEEGMADLDYY